MDRTHTQTASPWSVKIPSDHLDPAWVWRRPGSNSHSYYDDPASAPWRQWCLAARNDTDTENLNLCSTSCLNIAVREDPDLVRRILDACPTTPGAPMSSDRHYLLAHIITQAVGDDRHVANVHKALDILEPTIRGHAPPHEPNPPHRYASTLQSIIHGVQPASIDDALVERFAAVTQRLHTMGMRVCDPRAKQWENCSSAAEIMALDRMAIRCCHTPDYHARAGILTALISIYEHDPQAPTTVASALHPWNHEQFVEILANRILPTVNEKGISTIMSRLCAWTGRENCADVASDTLVKSLQRSSTAVHRGPIAACFAGGASLPINNTLVLSIAGKTPCALVKAIADTSTTTDAQRMTNLLRSCGDMKDLADIASDAIWDDPAVSAILHLATACHRGTCSPKAIKVINQAPPATRNAIMGWCLVMAMDTSDTPMRPEFAKLIAPKIIAGLGRLTASQT